MKARIKFGLIGGVVGLALNLCVASLVGVCGPFVALLAGAVAGFFAAQQEKAATKGEGAGLGAVSGLIAGALVLAGQLISATAALIFIQFSDLDPVLGAAPAPSADIAQQITYYVSGLGTGLCIGLVGVAVAALAGAAAGYLGTPAQAPPTEMSEW